MKQKLLMLAMLFAAFAMGAMAQDDNVTVVLDENFDSFTEGSEDAPATTDLGGFSGKLYKNLHWSYGSSKVYEAGGKLKIAQGGNLETDYLSKAVRGQAAKITLRLRAAADYGEAVTIGYGYGSTIKQVVLTDNKWHDVVVYTGAITTSTKLKLTCMFEGFLIDLFRIETSPSMVVVPTPELPTQADGVSFTAKWKHDSSSADYLLDVYSKAANGDKEYVLRDEVVKPSSAYAISVQKKVTGLDPAKTYYYTVRGRSKAGNVSDYSDEMRVIKVLDDIDAPKATAATNVTATSFTANWEAVPDAIRYAVTLARTETLKADTRVKVISEDFAKVTEGTLESIEFGRSQEELDAYTHNPGWYGVAHGFAAGYMVLSPYSGAATLTTPELDLTSDNGAFTLNIKMAEGAYGRFYSGGKATVSLYNDDPNMENFKGSPVESKTIEITKSDFDTYTVSFSKGVVASYVQISYNSENGNKLFIDEMSIEQNKKAGEKVTEVLSVNETADTHYDFSVATPKAGEVYSYYVNAIGETVDGGEAAELYSNVSNVVEVTLGGTDGIDGVAASQAVRVSAQGGTITVEQPTAGRIAVYDLAGRQIAQVAGVAGANTLSVATGQVVVVRAAGRAVKLAL